MTFEKRIISVGRKEYEVIHCRGEGQCTCRSCEAAGKYGRHWTDWMYKLNEESEELFCIDCLKEKLINERENEAYLRGFEDGNDYATKIEELTAINERLQQQLTETQEEYNKVLTQLLEAQKPAKKKKAQKDTIKPVPGQLSIFDREDY